MMMPDDETTEDPTQPDPDDVVANRMLMARSMKTHKIARLGKSTPPNQMLAAHVKHAKGQLGKHGMKW